MTDEIKTDDEIAEPEAPEAAISVREELERQWSMAEAGDDAGNDDADESLADAVEGAKDDEPASAADDAPPADETNDTADQPDEADEAEPDDDPAIDPPASWSAAAKAKWGELPPDIRQEILRRESDVARGFERKAAEAKEHVEFSTRVRGMMEPFGDELRQAGRSEEEGIQYLLAAHRAAKENPSGYIVWAARELGVDLTNLDATQHAGYDPQSATRSANIEQVVERRVRDALDRTQMEREIEQFRESHPHFDTVRGHMGALLRSGTARDLPDAYEQAVYANPETRKLMLAEQRKAEDAKRAEAERKRVERAKAASASVKGSPPGTGVRVRAPEPAKSVREELERSWEALSS